MLAIQPRKRAREPTPPQADLNDVEHNSPLEWMIKKRRRSAQSSETAHLSPATPDSSGYPTWVAPYETPSSHPTDYFYPPPYETINAQDPEEVERGIERRRMKLWERRNAAPASSSAGPSSSNPSQYPLETPQHSSSQISSTSTHQHGHHGPGRRSLPLISPSPLEPVSRSYLQPETSSSLSRYMLSSSPIRHQPPDSSPFRSSTSTRVDSSFDQWEVEELGREWGEEYAHQNSVLYQLVRLLDHQHFT